MHLMGCVHLPRSGALMPVSTCSLLRNCVFRTRLRRDKPSCVPPSARRWDLRASDERMRQVILVRSELVR